MLSDIVLSDGSYNLSTVLIVALIVLVVLCIIYISRRM